MFTEVFVPIIQFVFNMVICITWYADPACFSQTLYASCNIHTTILNYITDIDPNSKFKPFVGWEIFIIFFENFLNFNSALNSIHHTCELSQKIVAWSINNPAGMVFNLFRHQCTVEFKRLDRKGFIVWHQQTVALYVSRKDGSEFPCDLIYSEHEITFWLGVKEDDA